MVSDVDKVIAQMAENGAIPKGTVVSPDRYLLPKELGRSLALGFPHGSPAISSISLKRPPSTTLTKITAATLSPLLFHCAAPA